MLDILLAILLIASLLAGWLLTVIGLPGNWLMVVAASVYAFFMPDDSAVAIGWGVVASLVALAALGEVLELAAGAFGAAQAGGSKRGAVLALLGSMTGGIVGIFVGLPIPLVGPILAAVLFAGLGALGGAMLGETWKGRDWDQSWRTGKGAFWGRLFGTLGKILVGSVMVAVTVAAVVF